jgi:hypothetical protein
MIEIRKDITIPKIKDLFDELRTREKHEEKIDLLLPKAIKQRDFGVLFSLLQFVATWIRSPHSNSLILPISNEVDHKDYMFEEFVYPSIVLSWEKEILNSKGDSIKHLLKDISKEYFRMMEFFLLPEKESTPIYCFDHDLSKRGLPRTFYGNDSRIVSEATLDITLFPAFEKISIYNKKLFFDSIKEHLTTFYGIIQELFENTDEHARTNELGFNLYPNIRAVYLKYHKRNIDTYKSLYQDHPGLLDYFNSEFSLNSKKELYLLEISVLDSGPGLVKRFEGISNLEMSMSSEVESIKKCLYKESSSTKVIGKTVKGLGLDRVLRTIDKKGFVRIKSGRADVFRDMKKFNYQEHTDPSQITLYDWKTNDSNTFTENVETAGTLVSIIYPLDYKDQ